jgi:hypothetical protein
MSHNPVLEARVRFYQHRIRHGKSMPMAAAIQKANGRMVPLTDEDYCRLEAARREGAETVPLYVIKEADNSPEDLERLRKMAAEMWSEGN